MKMLKNYLLLRNFSSPHSKGIVHNKTQNFFGSAFYFGVDVRIVLIF